ncbi:MAG: cupin domain-containing protein [Elusimicrobia bacterium]|nr:cupin domain-containing protein [Elusimicrobiota bacterium]
MPRIVVERPDERTLARMSVRTWPIWTKEPSTFDWSYDSRETCYIVEGKARVKTDDGVVEFGPGDLVTFPPGLTCVWNVLERIRKHYRFD